MGVPYEAELTKATGANRNMGGSSSELSGVQ